MTRPLSEQMSKNAKLRASVAQGVLRIGDFEISAEGSDTVHIYLAAGPAAGEGGAFKVSDLLDEIEKFYAEKF